MPQALGLSFARVLLATNARPERGRPELPALPRLPPRPEVAHALLEQPPGLEAGRHARPDDAELLEPLAHDDDAFDPLDPAARRAALLAPPLVVAPPPSPATSMPVDEVAPRARVSMEELLPQLVRRIAWAGDRRKGTVQLELGAGRHAGTTITVHADAGRVRVELHGAGDVDELRSRIYARLKHQGLDVDTT